MTRDLLRLLSSLLLTAPLASAAATAVSAEHSISPIATGPAASTPSRVTAAFAGGAFLTAWSEEPIPQLSLIYGARFSPTGALLDPSGLKLGTSTRYLQSPVLSSDGAHFLLAYVELGAGP